MKKTAIIIKQLRVPKDYLPVNFYAEKGIIYFQFQHKDLNRIKVVEADRPD